MPNKPDQTLPGEEEPLPLAVLRLHWKKIFYGAAAAVLLIWGLAALGDSLFGRSGHWVTQLAQYGSEPVKINAQAFFVREELPLPGAAGGTAVPFAQPGERVGKGQAYALVCPDDAAAGVLKRQMVLEQRLRWLQEAEEARSYQALSAEQLGRQVDECFTDFLRALDGGGFAGISARQEVFLQRATTLEAALGRPVDFAGEIAEVKRELADLRARADPAGFARLEAPGSGDYYPAADGFERVYTPQALAQVNTVEELRALLKCAPLENASGGAKLVTGFRWYMAAVLPGGQAQQLEEGARYQVMFPQESARAFTMRVERIRRGGEEALAVFSCEDKDDAIQCLRGAAAEIVLETADGLRVPSSALRFPGPGENPARRYVYIVRAGQLQLREVEVLYDDGTDMIVAWGLPNETFAVEGDRIAVQGELTVIEAAENRLLLVGQELVLVAESDVKPIDATGPSSVVTTKRKLFTETIVTGKNLAWEQKGGLLVLTGEGITYREQRGLGLKIHDTVLAGGKAS
ncbi:MAG: hypothetical protein FWE98_08070 [Oscillospiraceae bacterium]|nr:hypothetical protein [Oscillospiraceae bacterium]